MKRSLELAIVILPLLISLSCSSTTSNIYYEVRQDIKSRNVDFAFMKLNSYLRENPDSARAPEIKFAIIEYYFQTNNYRMAIEELAEYIRSYPKEKDTIFAQAILYKVLLDYKSDSPLLEKLKEAFFSKSVFLIFSESKTKYYRSIFDNTYKIVDYVNRVEVFKNKELLFELTP